MAWYPKAIRREITKHRTPMAAYRRLILHTAVSSASSLFSWHQQVSHCSHFYLRADGTCLTPEHRVLAADLRWVAGGDLAVGDRLVGFDESGATISGGRRYHESVVEWIERDEDEVYAVVLDDERIVYTTADHRWLAQTNESWTWRRTVEAGGRTLVGARIPRLFDVWETRSDYDAGWFAGLLDGEGHMTARHSITFSQRPTAVFDRAVAYLKSEGYSISDSIVSGGRGDCHKIHINGPLATRVQLLGSHRPIRLLARVDVNAFGGLRRTHAGMNKVLAVYPVGVREIVKMQTSTRTFVAEGFGMHNCEQYVDTRFRAPNQIEGNPDSISVESQDKGGPFPGWSGSNVPAWTAKQVDAIAELAVWLHSTHNIPLVQLPSSRPGTRGIGWHRQGIDGNFPGGILAGRVSGGETWSGPGKVCPGDRRIRQVPGIITRAKQINEGDDMPLSSSDLEKIKDAVRPMMQFDVDETVFAGQGEGRIAHGKYSVGTGSRNGWAYGKVNLAEIKKTQKQNAAILAAVGGLDTSAILARIDQRSAEDAARDEALTELVDGALSGERDAAEVLRLIADILRQAAEAGATTDEAPA